MCIKTTAFLLALAGAALLPGQDPAVFDANEAAAMHKTRARAAAILDRALASDDVRVLARATAEAADRLPESSNTATQLRALGSLQDVEDLADAMEALHADLVFTPLVEAPLPDGFPPTAPVGEVVLKATTVATACASWVRP
jgi:hypothetical protein